MNDEKLKKQIGANIAAYRKQLRLTQAGLAEKLNYSDKAVSKWERGESVPDVLILCQLAELFQITVNELVEDPNALPENSGSTMERVMGKAVEKTLKRKADKRIILGLSSVLVWFVALLVFVVFSTLNIPKSWLAFILAIPANAVVLLSLRSAWRDFRWNQILISAIVWGSILSVYMLLLVLFQVNFWKLFLLGIPGQIAVLLWARLYRKPHKEESNG
ncbi:MAG: helix-turn-helix domain-containing protein [Oscillospiraceae bacterium]|nr:helix-turn-helix domain-containing protein [Oscillospiraceae bacterium]